MSFSSSSQASLDVYSVCKEPIVRIDGFAIAPAQRPVPVIRRSSGAKLRPSPSLLSLNLASSSLGSVQTVDPSEELFSDDEGEEFGLDASPYAIPIIHKDDEHYKMMLHVRAVVNARLWQSQAQSNHQQQAPQQRRQ